MPIPALAIPAALGLAQAVGGLIGGGKAKREAARLQASRPVLGASPYNRDQLSLAESELSTGMSAESERAYEEGLDRDLSSSIQAVLQGGGDVNNVSELFDRSAQGRQRIALMRENLRLQQIQNLDRARQASEAERLQQFQFNQWAPWSDRVAANANARQQSQNMLWGGLQTVAGAATNFLGNQQTQNNLQGYFDTAQSLGQDRTIPASTRMPNVPMNPTPSPASRYDTLNPVLSVPGLINDEYYFPD